MTARALIVAIEDYPNAGDGLANHLEGTNAAGEAFRSWFIETKHGGNDPGPDFLRYCGATGRPGVTGGTTRNRILAEMEALILAGTDRTNEFYLFFSGHGFAFEERRGKPRLDVLLGSNFEDLAHGGRASLLVGDLQENAQIAFGPGDQYYFIDACRNVIGPRDVRPLPIDNVWPVSLNSMGCVLTLFSTRGGDLAHVRSGFADALLSGLNGVGRAKGRLGPRMVVTFDGLTRYVRSRMPEQQPSPANPQACDGIIRVLDPAPKSKCRIRVDGVDGAQGLVLVVSDPNGDFPDRRVDFQGPTHEIELSPNEYGLAIVDPAGTLVFSRVDPTGSTPVDLWDSREVGFALESAAAGVSAADPARLLVVSAPDGTRLSLFGGDGSKVFEVDAGSFVQRDIEAGRYRAVFERGQRVTEENFEVSPGQERRWDLQDDGRGGVRDRILVETGNDPDGNTFEVSESLGRFTDANLGLLLSLLGASRIVEPHGAFEKLRHLRLATFDDLAPGDSVAYVLAAFDDLPAGGAPIEIGVGGPGQVTWQQARPVPGLAGLYDYRVPLSPGGQLLWFRVPGRSPWTLTTHALPNRATLITVSEWAGAGGDDLEVHQYMLPLYACSAGLSPDERRYLYDGPPLRFARLLWRVQSQFSAKRPVSLDPEDASAWQTFLYGKWLDPIIGILAAYELIRRGQLARADKGLLPLAVHNLTTHFGSIPDAQLLARLLATPWVVPISPPLVRHGLLIWPNDAGPPPSPLPRDKLLFQSMWTAWSHAL